MESKNKVSKFQEEITKSDKEIEEELIQFRLEQAELDVKNVISTTKRDLISAKKGLNAELQKDPFNFNNYAKIYQTVKDLENGLEMAESFLKEMF